jgi:hypothetical protein
MARIKSIYSESHDQNLYPKKPRQRGRKKRFVNTPQIPEPPSGPPPNMSIGFLPKNLSDEQRLNIRARQLLAEKQVSPLRKVEQAGLPMDRLHPVNDHDVNYDQDLDVPDPRGQQGNQFAGPVNTVFPEVRGPQHTHTRTRTLPKYAEHPVLPDFEPSNINASKELIAAVSADDQTILAFDNELTILHTVLLRMKQKAERMLQSVRQQDDNPGDPDSPTSHAQNVVQMLTTIIIPWYLALDDEFNQLLSGTEQSEALEEEMR